MAATVAERHEDPVRFLTRACLKPAGQPAPGLRTNGRLPTGKAPGNGVATAIGRGPPTTDGTKLMLAFAAAVLLGIAFIIHATETSTQSPARA